MGKGRAGGRGNYVEHEGGDYGMSVWFVRGSAFYNLTVAKEQGPYAGNQQHQYRPPQAASHISLQVHINRVRESICSYSRTNKQTINQNEKPSYQYNIDDAM